MCSFIYLFIYLLEDEGPTLKRETIRKIQLKNIDITITTTRI